MARSENDRMKRQSDEDSSLGSGTSSQFGSEFDEISYSGNSSLIEDPHVGDEDDINSDEIASSSSSVNSDELDSSSSSSSGSISVPLPQHKLLDSREEQEGSRSKESGSAKLRRILYGSSSSSFSNDSDVLVSTSDSSSSSSEAFDYDRNRDKSYFVLRNQGQVNSYTGVDFGNKSDRERNQESMYARAPPKNEEHIEFHSSLSSQILGRIVEEVGEDEESMSNEEHIENDGMVEGNISTHSEVLSKQSKTSGEADEGNETPSYDGGAMGILTAASNLTIGSDVRSLENSKHSISNNSPSSNRSRSLRLEDLQDQGLASKSSPIKSKSVVRSDERNISSRQSRNAGMKVTAKTAEADSDKYDGDTNPQGTAHSEIPEHNLIIHPTDSKPSTEIVEKNEPKTSTSWVTSEKINDKIDGSQETENVVGWKPPALTTFGVSKSRKTNHEQNSPKARDPTFQPKQRHQGRKKGDKDKERKGKSLEKNLPPQNLLPPISHVMMVPSDDISTLGTEGTYLERFPKKKRKKKKKEDSKDKNHVQSSGESKKIRTLEIEEAAEERSIRFPDENDLKIDVRLAQDDYEIPEIIQTKMINNQKGYQQELQHHTEKRFGPNLDSGIEESIENDKRDRGDPPGDAFRFSYVRQDEKRPLLGLHDSSKPSSSAEVSDLPSAPQLLPQSKLPMTSWVPTTEEIEKEVEKRELETDPTKAFIDSVLAEKRSMPLSESTTNGDIFKPDYQQQHVENGNDSEHSRWQHHIMKPSDNSRSKHYSSHSSEKSKTPSASGMMAPVRRLLRSRGSISKLIGSGSDMEEATSEDSHSKTPSASGMMAPVRRLLRSRGSISKLIGSGSDMEETISDDGDSRSSYSEDVEVPVRGLPRSRGSVSNLKRRGSVSKLNDSWEIEIGTEMEETMSDDGDSRSSYSEDIEVPVRGLPRRRGSVSNLQRRGSVSKLDDSQENEFQLDMVEDKSADGDSRSSYSEDIEVPVRGLPRRRGSVSNLQRRGSVSKLDDSPENEFQLDMAEDKSDDADSQVSDKANKVPKRGLSRERGSFLGLIKLGSVINFSDPKQDTEDNKSDDSDSKASGKANKVPERGLSRDRGSFLGLIKLGSVINFSDPKEVHDGSSDDSAESSSLLPTSELEEQIPSQGGRQLGRNRRTVILLWWFIAVLFIASAIIIVVLWQMGALSRPIDGDSENPPTRFPTLKPPPTLRPSSNPLSDVPSFAPSQVESSVELYDLIIEAYPASQPALEDPTSPQSKALAWLESSANDEISEKQRLRQRYALATLYYSTNGDDWKNNTGWLSKDDECYWMSTAESICDASGAYTKLDLQENNLRGQLPGELGILSDTVRSVITRKNDLSGEIPSSIISNLNDLQVLDLSSNKYSGVLVQELFEATSLTRLSLFENNISSSIPTEIGQLTKLGVLDLGSNKLTSTIPSTIAMLSKLAGLSLFDNMLTGTVPSELSSIQSLEMLYIDSNRLEAPLPEELCLLGIDEFWADCERIQCTCCTMCCADDFGCVYV